MKTLCNVNNLSKSYPSFSLSDISFKLKTGTITGFIGRNGAGKTTTIKSILGLVHPDCGEINYFDLPFSENEREIKQRIGFSTGTVNYYPRKKIKNIVAITKTFYKNWDESTYQKNLKLFSLDENKMPCELSEGMKVKFNLLLALSHRAEILIFDEPTSGLDGYNMRLTVQLFKQLAKEGKCVLLITHDMDLIAEAADCVLYLEQGKVRYHRNVLRKV